MSSSVGQWASQAIHDKVYAKGSHRPPADSWWVTSSDEEFTAAHQRELPRIVSSGMAQTIKTVILGGTLPRRRGSEAL